MPDHKPNDEPKISPSAMKAAEYKTVVEIDAICPTIRKLAAGIVATYGFAGPPDTDKLIERIDAATHLTKKEAALRELVEASETYRAAVMHSDAERAPDRPSVKMTICLRVGAACAKAKKVMEL